MTFAQLIQAALPVSLALIVIALGMHCPFGAAVSLFRDPGLLLRSVLSMNVVMPFVAVVIAANTSLSLPVKVALMALAVAPVPPVLPPKELRLVARESYVFGLLVVMALLSIVLVPLTIAIFGAVFGRQAYINPLIVARVVALSVLAPLALGMVFRHFFPALAARAQPLLSKAGTVVLLAGLLIILLHGWRGFVDIADSRTLVACAAVALIGVAVGHFLGGPNSDDRTVLALATASRHPGIAAAVGGALFPGDRRIVLTVLLYLIVASIVTMPYSAWRKRLHARVAVMKSQ
jgi:bile acid:Na+ symporter, BASS family